MTTKPKRPRDPNQLAKLIVDLSTRDSREANPDEGKDPAAVLLGKRGASKGGKARANKLTPERRSEIAKRAIEARWGKSKKPQPSTEPSSDRARKKRRVIRVDHEE